MNIYDEDLRDNIELNDVGYLIALTGNDSVNKYALNSFSIESTPRRYSSSFLIESVCLPIACIFGIPY